MDIGAAPRFNAVAMAARYLGARSSIRLLKLALGCTITLCGALIIVSDLGSAAAPLLRGIFGAISGAMP